MRPRHGREQLHAESGFALIEVLISGMIAVVAATGIFALMQASIHSAGDQRNRTQAFALAQEDQARLRASRIPSLKNLNQSRPVVVDGLTYTVKSKAEYVNDSTGLLSCGNGTSSADYIKISSEVTWPNMSPTPATTLRSIISPPSGSLNPKAGTLTVRAERALTGQYVNALELNGTGSGTFSGSTDSSGCAVFPEQAEGAYTMAISSGTSGLVNKDGEGLPANKTITVNPETTTTVDLYYDLGGKIPVTFKRTNYSSSQVAAKTEKLIVFHPEMKTSKVVGTAGSLQEKLEATSLFPFTSTYALYAGACTTNNPVGSGASPTMPSATVNVLAPAGGTAATQSLVLPSLLLNAKRNGTATDGLTVRVYDADCEVSGSPVIRTYTTSTQPPSPASGATAGRLAETALPYGDYWVCVQASISGTTRREYQEAALKTATTTKNFEITSGDSSGACA